MKVGLTRGMLVTVSVLLHGAVALAIYIASIWELERLDPIRTPLGSVGVAVRANPGGSPPTRPRQVLIPKAPRQIVKVLVQPVRAPVTPVDPQRSASLVGTVAEAPVDPAPALAAGEGAGAGSGDGKGDGDGAAACATPPCDGADPGPPRNIAPSTLGRLRLSGETQIHPSERVLIPLYKARQSQVTGTFEVCVSETGAVSSATLVSSTGYADYDGRLRHAMLGWRYRPFSVDGQAFAVCGLVTFVYKLEPIRH